MLEASAVATAIPSLWSAFNSWFTPAVLFLLLNLMIATIALTSSLTPSSPPSHLMHPYHLQQEEDDDGSPAAGTAAKQPPSISILDRVKSLGLFSPSKSSPQQRQPPPLIPQEEVDGETVTAPVDPFEKKGLGQPGSTSPAGKFESFDLYGYLPQEPASEIPRESNPAHYIFEQTHPQEVLLPAERDGKIEQEGEEEDGEVEEKEDEEEEEEDVEDDEEEREVPNLLLRRGIRRSESLNVKFSFSNLREEEEGKGGGVEEGDVVEAVEKRRPATAREGKGKWGDEEVDARADDFINRFKQQLKLQRMDSLAKQKDVKLISKVRSF